MQAASLCTCSQHVLHHPVLCCAQVSHGPCACACRKREAQLEAQISQKAGSSGGWDQQLQPQASDPVRPWATATLGYATQDEEVRQRLQDCRQWQHLQGVCRHTSRRWCDVLAVKQCRLRSTAADTAGCT